MTEKVPEHVILALDAAMADPGEVYYCHYCDGLRRKSHDCPHPNLTLREGMLYHQTGELPDQQ